MLISPTTPPASSSFFFFSCSGDHRDLHSFPTRRSSDLAERIGECRLPKGLLPRLWASAAAAVGAGLLAKLALPAVHPIPRAIIVLGLFGAVYLGSTLALGVSEARQALARIRRLLGR